MGVGTPPDLLEAVLAGVDMFDCVLPTHLGWQGTAFTSTGRVRITRGANASADVALDARCACTTCARYSRSYLHHLFKCSEPLGPRLLCIHNLYYYHALMAEVRLAIEEGRYAAFARATLEAIDRHEHSERRLGRARAQAAE
jgi:queuine tRNA-ribosyltransferase